MTEAKGWFSFRGMSARTRFAIAILGGCAAVILVTTIFIVVQILRIQVNQMGEAVTPETAAPTVTHSEDAKPFGEVYELQDMTVSLGNRNQTLAAYAEFNLVLDCPNKEAKRWMEMNRASIRDVVYERTVSFTVEDFGTPQGFGQIKQSILTGLKARFGAHAPRDLAIRDWVIR